MDEPTLGDALRARPPADPTYRPSLDPERPGERRPSPGHQPRRGGPVWAIRLVTLGLIAVLAAGGVLVVGSMPGRPSDVAAPALLLSAPSGNGRIAYDRDGDIWLAEADGSGGHAITAGPDVDRAPSWSPDGQWIAYWRGEGTDVDLRIVHPDGSDDQLVAAGPLDPLVVAWVPAYYHTLVYTVLQPAPEIETVIVQQTVTREGRDALVAPGIAPAFARDGQMAYLTSRADGQLLLWSETDPTVSEALAQEVRGGPSEPGSPPYRVERPDRIDTPSWDPTGRFVALAAGTATDRDIVLVDVWVGGGGPRWSTPMDEWSPVWSPDATELAWLRDDGTRSVIQTVRVDGSSQGRPIAVEGDATAIVGAPDGSGWLVVRPGAVDFVPWTDRGDATGFTLDAPRSSGIVSWEAIPAG